MEYNMQNQGLEQKSYEVQPHKIPSVVRGRKFIIFLAFCFLLFTFLFWNEVYRPHTSFSGEKAIEITHGMGLRQIAELFKREGIIRSKWIFVIYVSFTGHALDLKSGEYKFGKILSIADMAKILSAGGVRELSITIPEGWDIYDIKAFIEAGGISSRVEFEKAVGAGSAYRLSERFEFLRDTPPHASLEGYLFPDTYRIFIGTLAEEIVEKMLVNFDRKITAELRAEIIRRNKNIFEVITIASLIEKEVVTDEDRTVVSGILWKRLAIGIPLQVDATIIYIKNQKSGIKIQGNGKISIEDTKIDSPFNTYKYAGLPAGPIANPGLSAIRAAIFPKESPYFYYLSASDGRTIFSKTLDEHNAAKVKYLTR